MPLPYLLIVGLLIFVAGCSPGEILSETAEAADSGPLSKFEPFEIAYPNGLFEDVSIENSKLTTKEADFYEINLQTSLILEGQQCHVGMSYFDGRTIETFEDTKYGIKFSFPYAPKWAHSDSSPRYEWIAGMEYETLRFGPVATPEGCSLPTYYFVSFLPAGTSDSVGSMGLCGPRPFARLNGSKYTYEIYPLCGDLNGDEAEILQRIVDTIQL